MYHRHCGRKATFYIDRLAHLAPALEMGEASASHERSTVGEGHDTSGSSGHRSWALLPIEGPS